MLNQVNFFSEASRFKAKSDEPHSGTNRLASLGNSEGGNSIIISGCQVSYNFLSNNDFSLR